MANGHGLDDKAVPWQFRAVALIGVPAALAIYFAYAITTSYFSDIKSINKVLIEHNNAAVGLSQIIKDEHEQHKEDSNNVIKVLIADCINSAKSNEERGRCIGTEPLLSR